MDLSLEQLLTPALIALFSGAVILLFYRHRAGKLAENRDKLEAARAGGMHEPLTLHPVSDPSRCIGCGACVIACPEEDVLGLIDGRSQLIFASRCVGHGACYHACPEGAISLVIGTETRGVELPHVDQRFQSSVDGIYIAGELGGMGLIKNAVEQGQQAVENIAALITEGCAADYDLIIIGAGPAGIAASLAARKNRINFLTLDQGTVGGAVFSYPRQKIVMTAPMNLPLKGKVKLGETNKAALLSLWNEVLARHEITISENEKVTAIERGECFEVVTSRARYRTGFVLLAIGRGGSPRKLGVPGEEMPKVAHRLLDPELINGKQVLVAGGGNTAIEAALLLADHGNEVVLSYRGAAFNRLQSKNLERIGAAERDGAVRVLFQSSLKAIKEGSVVLEAGAAAEVLEVSNDLVYVLIGGELPSTFLRSAGVEVSKRFGEAIL